MYGDKYLTVSLHLLLLSRFSMQSGIKHLQLLNDYVCAYLWSIPKDSPAWLADSFRN